VASPTKTASVALKPKEPAMTTAAETYPNPSPGASDLPPETEGSQVHPLIHAGKWLVADLFSTLLFVGLYAVTHSIYVATGLAIAAGVAQIVYLKFRRSPIDAMQWMSLGLVVLLGGASLFAHDPRFIMLKPTFIYAVVGAVMLKPGWMTRYMTPLVLQWSRDVIVAFGYVWAVMMFATGALNVALVFHGDPKVWAWFIGVFPIASKLSLFAVQYLVTRLIVIARMRAAAVIAG
jgi:intracellular septation protein